MDDYDHMLAFIEARLLNERGYMCLFAMRGDTVRGEKHRYAANLLEALRKDYTELKNATPNSTTK